MAERIEHDFINSKGVFQGGGCKAVAFLGAYDAALKNGVCFTEFAGTSAGALFAALVAAGATVEEMKRFLGSLDVKKLVNEAEQYHTHGFWAKGKKRIISKFIKLKPSLVDVAFALKNNKGKFDAGIIERTLDKELQRILNIQSQIRFKDLPYPLTIVASDIKNHTFEVWNKTKTPNFPVAKAVSCSCAIPGYFIPVDDRYVDGGMLANLPVSFFEDNSDDYSTVLAFTLTYKEEEGKNNTVDYLLNIVSTVINGATELQLKSFRNNVFIVPVSTKLGLLDFNKLNVNGQDFKESIKEGFNSFRSFLKEYKNSEEYVEEPLSRNQYLVKVAACSCRSFNKVVAIVDNYKSLFKLFLTIVKWCNKSKEVCVYIQYTDPLGNSTLDYVIKLLAHMDIKVYAVYEELPILGYYFRSSRGWRGIAVKKIEKDYKAQYYNSEIESRMISNYLNSLNNKYNNNVLTYQLKRLTLKKYDESELIERLKNVTQYKNCTLNFEDICLDDLFFMHDFVYGYKYRAIDELVRLYKEANLELFSSAQLVLANKKGSIITPLIIEIHDGKKYVISGLTRLFYVYKQGYSNVKAVVVKNCSSPLPMQTPVTLKNLKIKDTPFDIEEKASFRYDNRNYRRIENVLRPMQNGFTDLK